MGHFHCEQIGHIKINCPFLSVKEVTCYCCGLKGIYNDIVSEEIRQLRALLEVVGIEGDNFGIEDEDRPVKLEVTRVEELN